MLHPLTAQPATYNKHGMTALGTTTPPMKQKKSFGMRSILTVVGLSLFFIIAISGVLIAQRQRQVAEPVAPTAPVSQPSAAMPVEPPVNACSKTFNVAFQSGPKTSPTYACDAPCTDDYQCKDTVRGGNTSYLCYRPTAGTAENWTAWLNVTEAIPDNTSSGYITSFSSHTRPDNSIKQYVVRDGKLYVRTSDANLGNWSGLIGPNTAMDGSGTGTLTSFSAFITPGTNKIQQHAAKGGKIWSRTSTDDVSWTAWEDHTANVAGVGTGAVRSFTAFIMPDGSIKQYLIVGNELYVRSSNAARTTWGNFEGPNSALAGVGGGDITSLSAYTKPDKSIKQFAVIGGTLYTRDNAGGKCRLTSTPTAVNCQGTTPTYSCGSTCTTDTQCQDTTKGGNTGYSCFGATGAKVCRLTANTASTTCEPAAVTYACNTACTSDAQCKTVNNDYICAADQGNRCRLDTNRGSATCAAPPKTYTCNATCDTTADCQSYNTNYVCYNAGGTTGKVCRLTGNETNTSCQSASAPPPTPAIGCNQTCATNADCSNTAHICYDTTLVGQTAGKVCRLANYVNSATCTTPSGSVVYTPPAETKGGQPALPAELPQTGPEDWLNWLKAGLITLGVGAALLLLL